LNAEEARRRAELQAQDGAFLEVLSPEDPLNQYINALIDPNEDSIVTPPEALFDQLMSNL